MLHTGKYLHHVETETVQSYYCYALQLHHHWYSHEASSFIK